MATETQRSLPTAFETIEGILAHTSSDYLDVRFGPELSLAAIAHLVLDRHDAAVKPAMMDEAADLVSGMARSVAAPGDDFALASSHVLDQASSALRTVADKRRAAA